MTARLLPLLALFTRSLRDDVRAKFPPIMRALAVLFVLLLVWGNQRSFDRSAPGQTLLMMLAMVNLAGATVIGLGSFCSAITEEKEEETIGLMLMTRLDPLAILLGKSTARLMGGLFFIVVQIPFTMLCVTLGGVTVEQVLRVYAILAAYLFFLCNLCLLWSVVCRRTRVAVLLSFAVVLALYVAPFMLGAALIGRSFFGGSSTDLGWYESLLVFLAGASPVVDTANSIFLSGGSPFSSHSISFHLAGGMLCFAASWLLFDRFCSGGGEIVPARAKPGGRTSRGSRFPRTWRRAIAWKDFHFLTGGVRGMVIRAIIYSMVVMGLLAWISSISNLTQQNVGLTLSWCGKLIFAAELGSLAARVFGNERKRNTLGSLVTLPISLGKLIWQKVFGCLPAFIPSLTMWLIGSRMYENWQREQSNAMEAWARSSGQVRYIRTREIVDTLFSTLAAVEFILFGILVAFLSLRMRRGPLLAGIVIILFGNILAGVVASTMRLNQPDEMIGWLIFMICISAIAAISLAISIPRRLAQCAAEE
jgi:hypothetical protein